MAILQELYTVLSTDSNRSSTSILISVWTEPTKTPVVSVDQDFASCFLYNMSTPFKCFSFYIYIVLERGRCHMFNQSIFSRGEGAYAQNVRLLSLLSFTNVFYFDLHPPPLKSIFACLDSVFRLRGRRYRTGQMDNPNSL